MTQRAASLAALKARIAAVDDERAAIAAEIAMLEQPPIPKMLLPDIASSERVGRIIDQHSETDQKISLFRRMFRGRTDVFPIRWENAKSGKSGYAPACHNEWQRGVCEKPRVKCSVCPVRSVTYVPGRSYKTTNIPVRGLFTGNDCLQHVPAANNPDGLSSTSMASTIARM